MPIIESYEKRAASTLHSIANGSARGHVWGRVARVLWLDPRVFDEVEGDPRGLLPALVIVLVAGLARGIFVFSTEGGAGVIGSMATAIVLWLVATGLLTLVGVRWVHGTTDFPEMLRTLGIAALPLWLLAPGYFLEGSAHAAAGVFVHAWAIGAAIVAVRQALDVGTARALAACGLSLALAIGLLLLLGGVASPH